MMGRVDLRPVVAEDAGFIFSVYASTRAEELKVTGWSAEQKEAFCRMQFAAQDSHYRIHYPEARHSVILHDGAAVGRLYVERQQPELLIVDIALLPQYRGGGIGTHLLRELQAEAQAGSRALEIHVEKFNPALKLYQRLGFQVQEDSGIYLLMRWKADLQLQ